MASPLHLRFRPAVAIAYRLISKTNFSKMSSFDAGIFIASSRPNRDIRSYTRRTPDIYDESNPMKLGPIPFRYFEFGAVRKTESDEAVYVFLYMPEVKKEDVKVYVEHIRNTTSMLVIEGKTHKVVGVQTNLQRIEKSYFRTIEFPENVDKNTSDIKGEMKDGMFKLTLPKLKHDDRQLQLINNNNIFVRSFRFTLQLRVYTTLASVMMMFARPYIIYRLSPDPFNSISMYKEVSPLRLYICDMYGLVKTEFNRADVCVSLNMPQLKIEDVKSYFKHDVLFIEGKTKTETTKVRYITGIRLPQSILKNRNMIKTEMKDGIYKATLPYKTFEIKIN